MNYLVLLSGGLDSVAALHWAREQVARGSRARRDRVAALGIDYGQPHRAELANAQTIAVRRGIRFDYFSVADAVKGLGTLRAPERGVERGVSRANIPARNPIFMSIATAHAARLFAAAPSRVVIGCNADDAAAFPDCTKESIAAASALARASLAGVCEVEIVAPWNAKTKAEIVRWCLDRRQALEDVLDSLSCYAGSHCGSCDACLLRAAALASNGVEDRRYVVGSSGGDPAREARR